MQITISSYFNNIKGGKKVVKLIKREREREREAMRAIVSSTN